MTRLDLTPETTATMRLILRIDAKKLSALIIGPERVDPAVAYIVEDISELSVKALENAVYDNSVLLNDFAMVDIIISSSQMFLLPATAADLTDSIAAAMLPDVEAPRTILCDAASNEVIVGYAISSEIFNFLQRTFACARFHHSLAITANWLMQNQPAGCYALVNAPADMALCSFSAEGNLRYLNRPEPAPPADCAYYILATAEPDEPMALMSVNPEPRAAIADIINQVKPSAQLNAPALPRHLLNLRHDAPDAALDMILLTQL